MGLRKNVMLADKYNEKRLLSWPKPWLVQPKINGRRCLAVIERVHPDHHYPTVTLLSSQGNEIRSVPHVNIAISLNNPDNGTWDGELWSPYLSFQQLASVVAPRNPVGGHSMVDYHVFDRVENVPMIKRIQNLDNGSSAFVRAVSTIECYSLDDISRQLRRFVLEGFEGIIIRHPLSPYVADSRLHMMKLKPTKEITVSITDIIEEHTQDGIPKNSLGALECKTSDGVAFRVGSGFTKDEREYYWDNPELVLGKSALIRFQDYTSQGVPYFTRIIRIVN